MNEFESCINEILVDTFQYITQYEEVSLRNIHTVPVTINEAHMIDAIAKKQDTATVSELAQQLGVTVPTATVAVKKLESKGFITKHPCPDDGRRYTISLTETGNHINRVHSIFHRRMVNNISRKFTEEERAVLLQALQKLRDFFKDSAES